MLSDIAQRHPTELMILGAVANIPAGYLAFWLAMRVRRRTDRLGRHDAASLALVVACASAWAATSFAEPLFVPDLAGSGFDPFAHFGEHPLELLVPFGFCAAIALVRSMWLRAGLVVAAVLFYLLGALGVQHDPDLHALAPHLRWTVFAMLLVATALYAVGMALMDIASHWGRLVATMGALWASKLIGFALHAVRLPERSVLTAHEATITPALVLAATGLVVLIAGIAVAEARRLTGERARQHALETSEERLRTLAEVSREGVVIHEGGRVIDANAQARKLLRANPVGREWKTFVQHGAGAPGDASLLVQVDGGRLPVEIGHGELGDGRGVVTIRDLSASHRAAERIRELAENDGLTGIANRRVFDEALSARLEREEPTTLVMIDLDRFKPINDTFGHAAGDAVLRAVASRLAVLAGGGEVVARIGGDEFSALLACDDDAVAERTTQRMLDVLGEPVEHNGQTLEVGVSIGHASTAHVPRPPAKRGQVWSDALRHAADLALYGAKEAGRGCALAFDEEMGRQMRERIAFEDDLRMALPRGELELHYQLQQDLRSGDTVGFEALMRWNSPSRGLVPPGRFIERAEEMGLIVAMGRWAIERATRDFAAYDDRTRVSVNISPIQFERGNLVGDVRAALDASGLDPARLELEVTESVLIRDAEGTLATFEALQAMGVALSLDDFGTGFASLSYLTRFPFSKIKIDRAFIDRMVTDTRSRSLVQSIVAMAASLGMRVTAEGVETQSQMLLLAGDACDEVQGFLLGRPVPIEQIDRNGPETRQVA